MVFTSCKEEAPFKVWRLTENIGVGDPITLENVEEITAFSYELPDGAVSISEEMKNATYYATVNMVAGDYIVSDKVSGEKPIDNTPIIDPTDWITEQNTDDYVIATPAEGDMHEELQKLINDNPNRTIYFPDGVYTVSAPLVISTEPEKRVSLRMSQYAVISVYNQNKWKKGDAVIHFGKGEAADGSNVDAVGARCYLSGGTIDSKGIANAIQIDGKGNILISHIALKNCLMGITVNTDNVDIDSVTGRGNSSMESTHIILNGSHNTVTNLRMSNGYYGVKLTKEYNVLRNVHPLVSGSNSGNSGTTGFWDLSAGNFYDYCYADQHARSFRLCDGNTSILNGCYSYWWSAENDIHWGIFADGRFNSVVYGTRIDMCHADTVDNAYLTVKEDGGDGKIITSHYQIGPNHGAEFKKYHYD